VGRGESERGGSAPAGRRPGASGGDLGELALAEEEPGAAAHFVRQAALGWHHQDRFAFAIDLGGRCAGTVVLWPAAAGGAGIGVAVAPWARGQGTGSAATRLAVTWAFAELGTAVVHWRAEVGHWSARRVAWACGMTTEGTVRKLLVRRGERVDAWVGSVRWQDPLSPRTAWLRPTALHERSASGAVRLDALSVDDVSRVAEACGSAEVQAWLPELPSPYTVIDAIAFVATREDEHASGRGVYWAVREWEGGPLVGTVGVFRLSPTPHSGEVGYWTHPDSVGRGLTTAAVRAVTRHALAGPAAGGLGLARVALRAARQNTASRRVALGAGYTEVGMERAGQRLRNGTVTDLVLYDALAREQ